MEIDLIQYLNEIGLNNNEALVYITLLSTGPTTVLLLAKSSEIKRSTVYNAIDTLIAKGLVHYEIQGTKKLIAAGNPEQLSLMMARKKQMLESVLPRLQALHTTTRPSESLVKQFNGLQGVRSVYSALLNDLRNNDDYFVISNQDKWYQLDPDFFEDFIRKRAKLKLNVKLLLQETPRASESNKKQTQYNEAIKRLPPQVNLDINMVITPNKTIIVQLINPIFALVIENKCMISMNYTLFDLLWSIC